MTKLSAVQSFLAHLRPDFQACFSHSTHLFLKKKCIDKMYSGYKTKINHITGYCKSKNNYETNPGIITKQIQE